MIGKIALDRLARRVLGIGRSTHGAGLDAQAMIRQLETVAGDDAVPSSPGAAGHEEAEVAATTDTGREVPALLAAVPAESIVDVDVRDILRAGGEPFAQIMAARRELGPGGVLRIRAIFEPAPLYFVFASQGLDHWTEQLGEEDWRVWFFQRASAEAPAAAPVPAEPVSSEGDDVVILDVRGMEPPEPMVQTLAALDTLPAGKTLLQINVREPKFLLPMLEERGFTYEVREQARDLVRTFIRRR